MASMRAGTAGLAAVTAAAAGVLTALLVSHDVDFVSGTGAGRSALDSVAATIGLLLAFLFYGRFQESRSQQDALLCAALASLATGNAVFSVLPQVAGDATGLSTASAYAGLYACGLFAAAVWSPAEVVDVTRRKYVPFALGAIVTVVLSTSWLLSRLLPRGSGSSADTFGTADGALLTTVQAIASLSLLGAAVGWCRSSATGDGMARSLAVACVLGSASRLDFALSDGVDTPWVAAATLLRLGFYSTLVVSAVVEIRGYWRKVAEVAVLEERRRIARELHDGLAQELAFAATQAQALADRSEHPTRARLVAAAAERALDESRRAIAALSRPLDEPLSVALTQCAEDVCGRFDTVLSLDVQDDVEATADAREALLRIVREAIANAVRHGGARSVEVRLQGSSPLRLTVSDDGTGFDPEDLRHLSGRFGLTSMRERAEALGGSFSISSATDGTVVEVALP